MLRENLHELLAIAMVREVRDSLRQQRIGFLEVPKLVRHERAVVKRLKCQVGQLLQAEFIAEVLPWQGYTDDEPEQCQSCFEQPLGCPCASQARPGY